ncbi:MAG: HAMP domain-containing protein [Desulfobacteraceae bacterium]|nr:MAG: HAMP domain-containing protein [Desulfobacteraceae bacterium]
MNISRQINIIIVISMGAFLVVSIMLSMHSLNSLKNTEISKMRETLLTERKNKLSDVVQNAYSVMETANFYEPAQKAIANMRFGENKQNYFFIVDYSGTFWVNPAQPDLVGKTGMILKDAKGDSYIQRIITDANVQGEGFIQYDDVKPGATHPSAKLVHFKQFKNWEWVICAGEYIDDIDGIVAGNAQELDAAMRGQVIQISIFGILAMIVTVIFSSMFFTKKLVLPIRQLIEAVEKITSGDFGGVINIKASQEINRLAEALMQMQNSFIVAYRRLKTLTIEANSKQMDDDQMMDDIFDESPGKTRFAVKSAI